VGAGPCGLVLSLVLAQAGIEVTLLERESTIDARPRAAHLAAPAIRALKRAGVLDDVRRAGFIPGNITWRKLDGSPLVSIKAVAQPTSPVATTVLPLNMLGEILLSHAEKNEKISLKWKHHVIDVGQDENLAWAIIQNDDGTKNKITADFLCGCDGGTSQVRKSLLGARNFPGETWNVQLVATNVSGVGKSRFPANHF
jgi:2-polyprenyl-6-methoxyphenol hydroxylase-like FAD-dependent oxidoreductase